MPDYIRPGALVSRGKSGYFAEMAEIQFGEGRKKELEEDRVEREGNGGEIEREREKANKGIYEKRVGAKDRKEK